MYVTSCQIAKWPNTARGDNAKSENTSPEPNRTAKNESSQIAMFEMRSHFTAEGK
jgi:hypothetical protein